MHIKSIKTHYIHSGESLITLLKRYVQPVERSVLVIASKILSLSQSRLHPKNIDKGTLVKQYADKILSPHDTFPLTQNNHQVHIAAGVDQSNHRDYILPPKNPYLAAEKVRQTLMTAYQIESLGIIFSDSLVLPLTRGCIGIAIGWSGIMPLFDYRGQKDLVGQTCQASSINVPDCLASAAILAMGEGAECTPFCLITELPPTVTFGVPSNLMERHISAEEDCWREFSLTNS